MVLTWIPSKPLAPEKASKLPLVGEPEDRRSDRNLFGRLRISRRYRVDEYAEQTRVLGNIPDRECESATRGEDAEELRGRLLRTAEMQHDEVPDDRIERPVRERERFDVATAKLDRRMMPTRE